MQIQYELLKTTSKRTSETYHNIVFFFLIFKIFKILEFFFLIFKIFKIFKFFKFFSLKPWPQSILTPCVKNFTAAPVPFRKSGQTFNVCDHHYF